MLEFQKDHLELALNNTIAEVEKPLDPFLDPNQPDRGPFNRHKASITSKMKALEKEYEGICKQIEEMQLND